MAHLPDAAGLRMLGHVLDTGSATTPILPLYSQKPQVLPAAPGAPMRVQPAKDASLSAAYLERFLREQLEKLHETHLHTLMAAKDGKLLLRYERHPYSTRIPGAVYSFSKTLTALAVGLLLDDGLLTLEDKPVEILEMQNSISMFSRAHRLTIRHLLTMTSGATFSESGAVTSSNWIQSFLGGSFREEPGTAFEYNSMNSYILAACVCKVASMGMLDLLRSRILEPMGITNVFWEKDRLGIEKGGWGLYLCTEDMLKLGQLYLNGGVWEGRQLISRSFVEQSTRSQAFDDSDNGGYQYGFQLWPSSSNPSFVFSGLFGQYTFVFPQNGMVVSCTAGCSTLFQKNAIVEIINRYFAGDVPLPGSGEAAAQRRLNRLCKSRTAPAAGSAAARRFSFSALTQGGVADRFCGFALQPELQPQNGIGLLPLMLQVLQNNYTGGLQSIRFSRAGSMVTAEFAEQHQLYTLRCGMGRYLVNELSFSGEHYLVAAACRAAHNEDGRAVLMLHLCFLEGANERFIRIYEQGPGRFTVRFEENPGAEFLQLFLDEAAVSLASAPLAGKLIAPLVDRLPGIISRAAFIGSFAAHRRNPDEDR